ncbi:MAG TPA: hypothetical protein ENG33_03830 [Chloroflexi bacterium]|nr:hypothetical protein [Chloroflexota bacterium]
MGRKSKQEIDRRIREMAARGAQEVKVNSLEEFKGKLRELGWSKVSLAVAPDMVLQEGEGDEVLARPGYKIILKADVIPEDVYVTMEKSFDALKEAENEASNIKKHLEADGFIIV